MRLFGRKETTAEHEERCPRCREHVPEGATECRMCGLALAPVRGSTDRQQQEAGTAGK
jgi:predicted amidophosphoribosyltransferase